MPKPSSSLCESFFAKVDSFEQSIRKFETLKSSGSISHKDLKVVYEALFINLHIAFEVFLEDLFIGLLVGSSSQVRGLRSASNNIIPRVQFRSHAVAREVIKGKNKYIEWLPYSRTQELAKTFFRGGRPFSQVNDRDIQVIQNISTIRNYIAHRSEYSKKQFEKRIISNRSLPKIEQQPSGFLAGTWRMSPRQTRYQYYVVELKRIARDLSA